jgi:hypothetical protein
VYGLESEKNDTPFMKWLLKFDVTTVKPFTIQNNPKNNNYGFVFYVVNLTLSGYCNIHFPFWTHKLNKTYLQEAGSYCGLG